MAASAPRKPSSSNPARIRPSPSPTSSPTPANTSSKSSSTPTRLALDDRRRLVAPVREAVRVLLVDGDPQPQALKSETAFLAQAIDPDPDPSDTCQPPHPPSRPLEVETIGESQLVARDLAPYDVLVLANIARFTQAEATKLEAYLAQGGGIVHFAGDRVVPENHNQLLYNDGKGLLPASLGPAIGDPTRRELPFEFDALGFKHPIVNLYAGEAPGVTASLTSVKSARYYRLQIPKGSAAQVVLAFSSGDPAVIESPRDRGRVLQVATSADAGWTTWPLHQSYPPIMEQIVLSRRLRALERTKRPGRTAPGPGLPKRSRWHRGHHRPAPWATPSPPASEADGEISTLRFDATDLSGLYQASLAAPLNRQISFAANTDPAESDPAKLDAQGLKAALPDWNFVYNDNWQPLSEDAGSIGPRGELHRPFLWGVLALLLTESFLAWKFGHTTPRRFT